MPSVFNGIDRRPSPGAESGSPAQTGAGLADQATDQRQGRDGKGEAKTEEKAVS